MAFFEPPETGEFNLGVSAEGSFASLAIDGRQIAQEFVMNQPGMHAKVGHIHLEQGKKVAIKVVYSRTKPGPARAQTHLVQVRSGAGPRGDCSGEECRCRHRGARNHEPTRG